MNYQHIVPDVVKKMFELKNIEYIDIDYYAWPQTFSSTSGPRNSIGGCAMTTFTIEAYVCDGKGPTIYICNGMYFYEYERFNPFKHIKNWLLLPILEEKRGTNKGDE